MLEHLQAEANRTCTENGAPTHRSTLSDCLDLFGTIGALRRAPEQDIVSRFLRAYAEDAELAMKILFFARDIRGGLGERRVFRVILRWLAFSAPRSVEENIPYIAEYGRYDDLLSLLDTPCAPKTLEYIAQCLAIDRAALAAGDPVSLLAKWLPSVNASDPQTVRSAKRIARALGMNDAAYRRTLSALRARIGILENNLRTRDYTFDYEKQPSLAMLKYRKAFFRNDGSRYNAFLQRVAQGKAVLHTGTLAPYDIIRSLCDRWIYSDMPAHERQALDVTWNAQDDFTNGENALVVMDGSGSMYMGGDPLPSAVALSLAIYFAERNTGAFRDHFITFSAQPRLVRIQGRDIYEKVLYCRQFDEVADTNLEAVFDLILDTATAYGLPQEDLPSRLYIISDMEFNGCVRNGGMTNFQSAAQRFAEHGYQLPEVVFWNIDSRHSQQPVTRNEQGVALVSGNSPRIFSLLQAGLLSPYAAMMDLLSSERYAPIHA